MIEEVSIRRLVSPSVVELDQIATIIIEALNDDSITRAGGAQDPRLMYEMARSVSAGAAVGAHLYAAFLNSTQKIVGTISFFGPGVEIAGDELQRSQGFDEFLKSLPQNALDWWKEFLPEYAAVTDAAIGAGVKKAAWTMNNFAVVQEHRGRGIGRALLEAGEALAKADCIPIIIEAEHKRNIAMYEHFGYKMLGEQCLRGGNGVADFSLTILRKDVD